MVKTSDCGSDMHGFESHQAPHLKKYLRVLFFIGIRTNLFLRNKRVLHSIAPIEMQKNKNISTKNVTFSHLFLLRNGVLHQAPHKKDFGFCQGLFYLTNEDENTFDGSSASELSAEDFCKDGF